MYVLLTCSIFRKHAFAVHKLTTFRMLHSVSYRLRLLSNFESFKDVHDG